MVMRISGLASGMDVDEIVTNLMKAERMPLDKIQQKKTYTEWQRDDYRTMNTALSELDTLIFDGIGKQSSFNKKTVTVSNPDAVSVKNVSSTSDFSGTINVSKRASAATMVSTVPRGDTVIGKDKLSKIYGESFAGQKITIQAINKDGGVDETPYTLAINKDDTLESVINKINADSGVTVFFDETSKQFSITAKNTGDAKTSTGGDQAEIVLGAVAIDGTPLADATDNFFTKVMNMSSDNVTAASADVKDSGGTVIGKAGTAGENAKLTYNGLSIERASNTFTINGAEITLKDKTTGPVTFSSTPDVDAVYDTIKKFVDSYNGLIATISEKTSEKKSSGYAPLTDVQKEAMTEDAVTKWEKLAKKGTLRNDSTLNSMLTKMRTSMYSAVSGTSLGSLSKLGITTTKDYTAGGKLEIKEETLREAIAKDPNGIYNLFMADGSKTVAGKTETNFGENGIARRLRADLKSAMSDIGEKAGKASSVNNTFTLGKLLDDYQNKISSFEKRMSSLETRYYKQFTAMETAINKANSQSTSLASYFTS